MNNNSAGTIDEQWRSARNILVVRLDNLGDVLVTTPAIHAIKTSLPESKITLFASPIGAQVGQLNPDIDDVLVYQAPWMDPWHKLPLDGEREQAMIATVKARHFDGAIIFTSYHQSPLPVAYLCYLAEIPLRVAASIDGPGSLLTTRHKHPQRMMHEVESGLDLISAIGMTTDEQNLVLCVPETARHEIRDILSELLVGADLSRPPLSGIAPGVRGRGKPVPTGIFDEGERGKPAPTSVFGKGGHGKPAPTVVVHPGCSMPARTYPWEMYADVVNLLVRQMGASVLLTGAEDERELVERIMGRLDAATLSSVHSMAGKLSFPGLCALIEAADVTITNNTGPMHISAAVKTPVVALFALTNLPEQWGPWHVPHRLLNHDVPCRICYSRVCPYEHECLRLVTPSMVVEATADLLTEALA